MNKTKRTVIGILACLIVSPGFAITGKEFVDCYDKAMKETIREIKEESPKVKICSQMTAKEKDNLYALYSYVDEGKLHYYNDADMGEVSVRFHYERLMFEVECYDGSSNIFSAWIKGFGDAIGVYNHTNLELANRSMTKLLGRDMWTENGSDTFSEHEFSFCDFQ